MHAQVSGDVVLVVEMKVIVLVDGVHDGDFVVAVAITLFSIALDFLRLELADFWLLLLWFLYGGVMCAMFCHFA